MSVSVTFNDINIQPGVTVPLEEEDVLRAAGADERGVVVLEVGILQHMGSTGACRGLAARHIPLQHAEGLFCRRFLYRTCLHEGASNT